MKWNSPLAGVIPCCWTKPGAQKCLGILEQPLWAERRGCGVTWLCTGSLRWAQYPWSRVQQWRWQAGLCGRLPLALLVGTLFSSIRAALCIRWGMKFSWVLWLWSSSCHVGTEGIYFKGTFASGNTVVLPSPLVGICTCKNFFLSLPEFIGVWWENVWTLSASLKICSFKFWWHPVRLWVPCTLR